jgi:hypothetical protein
MVDRTRRRRLSPSTRTVTQGRTVNLTRHTITAGVAALGLALTAAPALAKGGGDINNTVVSSAPVPAAPAPDPAPVNGWDLCPDYAGAFVQPDGSTLFGNVTTGGCLVARSSPSGALSIYAVYVPKGWTYSIKSSDPGKLLVEIPDPFTGARHSILVEPGKTKIQ